MTSHVSKSVSQAGGRGIVNLKFQVGSESPRRSCFPDDPCTDSGLSWLAPGPARPTCLAPSQAKAGPGIAGGSSFSTADSDSVAVDLNPSPAVESKSEALDSMVLLVRCIFSTKGGVNQTHVRTSELGRKGGVGVRARNSQRIAATKVCPALAARDRTPQKQRIRQ